MAAVRYVVDARTEKKRGDREEIERERERRGERKTQRKTQVKTRGETNIK